MSKTTTTEPYAILAATIKPLYKAGADQQALRAVADTAARLAPPSVRVKFSKREANKQLAQFLRFEAGIIADKKRDMSDIHIRLDGHLLNARNSEDAKKALRAIVGCQRSEMVAGLLRRARDSETTDLREHELQQAISHSLVPKNGMDDE